MFKHKIFQSLLILFFSQINFAYSQNATDILSESDKVRMPQKSFTVEVALKEYKKGSLVEQTEVITHSRKNENGQFASIVHIDSPANDLGKLLLRNENILWMYDPKSKASVRISPRQRLLGNVSTGDVISSNFSLDYEAKLLAEEAISDGDKQKRQAWKLQLSPSNDMATYHQVILWVDTSNYRPLKGEFYTQSGKKLSVVWYRGWKEVLGQHRPTELVVINSLDNNSVTVVSMKNFREAKLPTSWFNKEWLPQFEAQR